MPVPTGLPLDAMTMGIVPVVFLAARAAGVPRVTIASTLRRTISARARAAHLRDGHRGFCRDPAVVQTILANIGLTGAADLPGPAPRRGGGVPGTAPTRGATPTSRLTLSSSAVYSDRQ